MAINVFDSVIVYEKFFRRKTYWNPRIIAYKTFNPLANYFGKIHWCNAFDDDCFFNNFYLFFCITRFENKQFIHLLYFLGYRYPGMSLQRYIETTRNEDNSQDIVTDHRVFLKNKKLMIVRNVKGIIIELTTLIF